MEQSPDQLLGKLAGRFRRFPVLLKFLDAHERLSVQVHPKDGQREYIPAGESGKTEAWVVLEAGPASRIFAGLKTGTNQQLLGQALATGAVADLLASFKPRVGDAVFIRAGTVHSLRDLVVFEVQENSDVTFRLYDWDRVDPKTGKPRPLQVEQAVASVDFEQVTIGPVAPMVLEVAPARREQLFHCEHFSVWRHTGNRRSLSAQRARRGSWFPSSATASLSTTETVIPSAAATPCSCRRRSGVFVPAAQ